MSEFAGSHASYARVKEGGGGEERLVGVYFSIECVWNGFKWGEDWRVKMG